MVEKWGGLKGVCESEFGEERKRKINLFNELVVLGWEWFLEEFVKMF